MVRPERPRPDHYDNNEQIAPHFSKTPGLTSLPQTSRYYARGLQVKAEIIQLYIKHGFPRCPILGLYWAGSPTSTSISERPKSLLLAIELKEGDVKQWWKLDDEVREIMKKHELSGRHGVCVRYYQYWEGREEQELQQMSERLRRRAERARQSAHEVARAQHTSFMPPTPTPELDIDLLGYDLNLMVPPPYAPSPADCHRWQAMRSKLTGIGEA